MSPRRSQVATSLRARRSFSARGLTLVEVMVTLAVLGIGLAAIMMVVNATSASNRRELVFSQAQMVAQRELERITALGCSAGGADPCANVKALDQQSYDVYWDSGGPMKVAHGEPAPTQGRVYTVRVDVDPPFEGDAHGSPPVDRVLANGLAGNQINVRVVVRWTEDRGKTFKAAALQTRMAP